MKKINFLKGWLSKATFFFIMLFAFSVVGQDVDSRSPKPNGGSKQQQKADKKKALQRKKMEKGVEKGKKMHLKLQAKNARKMMKKAKKKSKKWNDRTDLIIRENDLCLTNRAVYFFTNLEE